MSRLAGRDALPRIRRSARTLAAKIAHLPAMLRTRPVNRQSGLTTVAIVVIFVLMTASAGWGRVRFNNALPGSEDPPPVHSIPHNGQTATSAGLTSAAGTRQASAALIQQTTTAATSAGATPPQTTASAASQAATTAASQAATTAASQATIAAAKAEGTTTRQTTAAAGTEAVTAEKVNGFSSAPFYGIDQTITSLWLFPLKVETDTPRQGVFAARRSGSRLHAGIDLYAADGTEVYAMTSGRVSRIYLFYESLLAIEVDNDDGTTIRYTELEPLVKVGDRVAQGQLIAKLRKNSSGSCMLHLEIYATVGTGSLTQTGNNRYDFVTADSGSFMRRSDLVDPSAVYQLPRP